MIWMFLFVPKEKKNFNPRCHRSVLVFEICRYWLLVSSFPGLGRVDADVDRVGSVSVDLLPGFVRLGRVIAVS